VYPLKSYESPFLEEKNFGGEESNWKKMYDNFIQEGLNETTRKGYYDNIWYIKI
jgi:hypothetical protein